MINLLIWFTFAALCGITERVIYSQHDRIRPAKPDEHLWYTIQRAFVALLIFQNEPLSWWLVPLAISILLTFPFIHDGSYYQTSYIMERKQIEKTYPLGWFDDPKDTTAIWSLEGYTRLILWALGVIIYTAYIKFSR